MSKKLYWFEVDSLVRHHNQVKILADSEEEAWKKLRDGKFEHEDVFPDDLRGDDLDMNTAWNTESEAIPVAFYLEPPALFLTEEIKTE